MGRRKAGRTAHWSGRAKAVLLTTLLLLTALLAGARVASAAIYDPDADPCWAWYLTGPVAGNDSALDVAMTSTATWVAGQVWAGATNELDASLTRVPLGSEVPPTVRAWNSAADNNDANYAVAARGSYVYTAGATRNAADNLDLVVIRWSSTTGAFKWARRFAGPAGQDDAATDVVVDADGNVIVCGMTQNSSAHTGWVVRKYSPAGEKKWTWTFDSSPTVNESPREMVVDGAGNVYVTGSASIDATTHAYTVKLSPKGVKLWARRYAGPERTYGNGMAIARCPSGGVYVGGNTTTVWTGLDMFLLRYTAAGDRRVYERFDAEFGGASQQSMNDLAVASDGRIFGVGLQQGPDPAIAVWDPAGDLYFSMIESTAGEDQWLAVGTDAYGGVYTTGPYDNASVNPDIRTQRLSVLSWGGGWVSDFDENGYHRQVNAMAVRGLACAVVGRQYNGTDYDQYVHIWRY